MIKRQNNCLKHQLCRTKYYFLIEITIFYNYDAL